LTNELLRQILRIRDAASTCSCARRIASHGSILPSASGEVRLRTRRRSPRPRGARGAWRRYLKEITEAEGDVSVLVDATELFTPADIEFAARKAAQDAFKCEHFGRTGKRATTQDSLAAIEQTRPTLAQDIIEGVEEDRRFVRYRRPGPAADLAGPHSRRVS
jgi:transitional endoplasmic reticulum ATPase